jgi:hypothetical protein
MMNNYGMGMGWTGSVLMVVLAVLVVAALVKYLRK